MPSFFDVGALLRSSLDQVIEQLGFPPDMRAVLETPRGRRIAAEEFQLSRQRMNDLCQAHGTMGFNIARQLAAEGFRGSPKPPAAESKNYMQVWSTKGEFYLSHDEYPELKTILIEIRKLPSQLRSKIIRRIDATAQQTR